MALTKEDWNRLSIVVSDAIDSKLDEKFNPITDKMNLILTSVEELYTRLDTFFIQLFEKLEQLNIKVILYNLPITDKK